MFTCSDFLRGARERDPGLFDAIEPLPDAADEAECMAWLRRWRRREMAGIAVRDLAAQATLEQTLEALSAFADRAVSIAYAHAWRTMTSRYGTPRHADGRPMPLVVLGMGKLGGRELNFSSDIDLIFLFPDYGETEHASPMSHDEFFVRFGQQLIRLLAAPTVDGFVFRVDMRLRPFGDSGPLACGFSAFEDYLVTQGRDWERYAYVKARALTAEREYAELYANAVRPFVYRRYLDFGVFESLREMKQLIEKQYAHRQLAANIKLGPGGIREIEFIAQAIQLIRGGQDRRLQNPRILEVLPLLAGGKLLPEPAVAELLGAYRFLRTLENRLQMLRDAQTHDLPDDERSRAQLARAMHQAKWSALIDELEHHRRAVSRHFQSLVFAPLGAETATRAVRPLAAPPAEATQLVEEFAQGSLMRRIDATGRRRLQTLLDTLLAELPREPDPLPALRRMLRVFEAIGLRSSYFALLNENMAARRRFIDLCAAGEFLANQIAAHPLLLDELLDERLFAVAPTRAELAADLADRMARVDLDDPERSVEALCQFKRAAVFRIAVADLSARLPLMQVSDRLTEVAELIIEQAMSLAWRQITTQFGRPLCTDATQMRRAVEVCAVGYGKLGGIELAYSSDLDLVFLHDSAGEAQETDGARPIDNQLFFVRLAQRIIHILTMHSAAGRLYEVDVRLRPSGKGGMLITGIEAFGEYQKSSAWTWEHQALLHARAVAGSAALRARFEALRLEIVTNHVRRESLREEVQKMRLRMRHELSKASPGQFDLKQDPGGIADIEFLAQYWALLHAGRRPAVAMFSDTIRQLESLASDDLVLQATVDVLTAAYRAYRERGHHRSLQDAPTVIPDSEFRTERAAVTAVWNATFGGAV